MTPPYGEDLRTLLEQVHAGVLLLEDVLDDADPSGAWVKVSRRGGGSTAAARNVWGQLSIAWVNLVHLVLERDPEIETWEIEPLLTRSEDGSATGWAVGPDRRLVLETWEEPVTPELGRGARPPVRAVGQRSEPRYTLAEARAVLGVCGGHRWSVEVDASGDPVAVACSACSERRPLP